jgi:hypothetical protein
LGSILSFTARPMQKRPKSIYSKGEADIFSRLFEYLCP